MTLTKEVLGGDLYFKVSTDDGTTKTTLGVAVGATISMTFPTIEVSNKGSGGYVSRKKGNKKSATVTHSGRVQFEDAAGTVQFGDIFTLADDGTEVDWYFEAKVPGTGDVTISGKGIFEQLDMGAPDGDAADCNITLNSTGQFSKTIAA